MVNDFQAFGKRSEFAIELRLLLDPHPESTPQDSANSWGEWRLWVAGLNLCNVEYRAPEGTESASEIRWFLAPLFRWIVTNWTPLLHEARLPAGGRWGDSRPRWARMAYLSMLESAGDDLDRFGPWQAWACRHALQASAEGGIVPDIFFHRVGDEMEVSWGHRTSPGTRAAAFVTDDGMSHVDVDIVATVFKDATDWFWREMTGQGASWASDLTRRWQEMRDAPAERSALYWYLDGQESPGPLSKLLIGGLQTLGRPTPTPVGAWWDRLAPEVAMFGALAPEMSEQAAVTLLSAYFDARQAGTQPKALADLTREEPAWMVKAPWANGYRLAEDVLDEADPSPSDDLTDIDTMLFQLGIAVKNVALGEAGPRGVALAGEGLRPTILVNRDHAANGGNGRRFTLAHELCHILFDQARARSLAHTSTPWASPAVEQRANAFAAMLLMPISRAKRPPSSSVAKLREDIRVLAKRLKVSETALKRHLANIGEISPVEGAALLGDGAIGI